MTFSEVNAAGGKKTVLTPEALQQLSAIMEAKAKRTPAQKKIGSDLLYEIKRRRADPLFSAVPALRTRAQVKKDGTVEVDIRAGVSEDLILEIESNGWEIINKHPRYRSIRVRLPLNDLEGLAELPEIQFIRSASRPIFNKDDTSQGDVAHAADTARSSFSIDGSDIKVGVLSDSVESLAALQLSGDLPLVTVLPGQSGSGSSEGTAMLEIVYDLAPGANLYFATALGGEAQFAQNILDLGAAGCDVIVDDVSYFAEGVFQDGIVAQAVSEVSANGALYFSSAGNSGNKNDNTSGVWEGDFNPIVINGNPDYDANNDFGSGAETNKITVDSPFFFTLQWSDPLGASFNDYDLFLFNPSGQVIFGASTNTQNGSQNPFEAIDSRGFNDTNNLLVIARKHGAAIRFMHLNSNRGKLASNTDGQTSGHSAAENAFSVAAVNVATAGGGEFTGGAGNPVETFSSDGLRKIFYDAEGTSVTPGNFLSTGGEVRQKPDITAADGVATATPGFNPFFGTSAAAPHAAAIAALMREFNPGLPAWAARMAFNSTSLDIETAGIDRDSGSGIIMADQILTFLDPNLNCPGNQPSIANESITGFEICEGATSVTAEANVTIQDGGVLTVITPDARFGPGFKVENGGGLVVLTSN